MGILCVVVGGRVGTGVTKGCRAPGNSYPVLQVMVALVPGTTAGESATGYPAEVTSGRLSRSQVAAGRVAMEGLTH